MRTRTATIRVDDKVFTLTYQWYIEYDGEYTVVVLEAAPDQEYDYELVARTPVSSELHAEMAVDSELRDAIKAMISACIEIRS